MIKQCLNCGNDIIVKPSHFDRKKYCSRSCKPNTNLKTHLRFGKNSHVKKGFAALTVGRSYSENQVKYTKGLFGDRECKTTFQLKNGHKINQHLKKQVTLTCPICEKTFTVPKNREISAKYCSKSCLGKANGIRGKKDYRRRVKTNCANCGQGIEKKPSEITTFNFCSVNCMGQFYAESKMFAGENSGTWMGGEINYYGPNWLSQRRKARKRDHYTCQDCGITEEQYGQELSVHHIRLFRDFNGD